MNYKICDTCKQSFQITIHRTRFCSHTCQAKWAITIASKHRSGPPKTGKSLECIVCKSSFYVPLYRLKKKCTQYCSRSCLAKNHLSKYTEKYGFKKSGLPHHTYKQITINGKNIRLHRYLMEQHLGRKLETWEHVHHINNDSFDNRLENLEVLSNSDHQKKEYIFRKSFISSSF